MVVDALLLCFCEDSQINDGSEDRPYYMNTSLRVNCPSDCSPDALQMHEDNYCCQFCVYICLQCFDIVGWAAGRASGL